MIVTRTEYAPGLGASASGMYRIGPSDLFTPGDLQADAKTLDSQVQALDASVAANTYVPAEWFTSWRAWKAAWDAYNSSEFGGWFSSLFASLNDSNRDDLIKYETQFVQWLSDANNYSSSSGAALPSGAVTVPSTGSGDTIGAQLLNLEKALPTLPNVTDLLSKVLWIGGGVVAVYVGFQVYKSTKTAKNVTGL